MKRTVIASLAVVAVGGGVAHADPMYGRLTVDASRIGLSSRSEQTRLPGPGLAVDAIKPIGPRLGIGAHVGVSNGFTRRHDANNTPHDTHSFDTLLQLHATLEYRTKWAALAVGLGIDRYRTDDTFISDGRVERTESYTSLGGHVQAAVEVASIASGSFELVGDAGLFPVIDVIGVISAGDATARSGSMLSLGVGFRPR